VIFTLLKDQDKLAPGKRVKIKTKTGLEITGLILPRYELYSQDYITIKLSNGYNIGIKKENIEKVEEAPIQSAKVIHPKIQYQQKEKSRRIVIIGTGGTIASKIDYETGGVKPILTTEELLEDVPELEDIAGLETYVLFNIFSEDMKPSHWEKIAEAVYNKIKEDPHRGVIIAHGTDTMAYTASALSFAIMNPPVPIAFVGSQRSSDRPSSDSAFNLIGAAIYATSDIGEVAVVMHGTTSDTYAVAHRGVRVRKMHSSRRDAFQSIESLPLALIYPYTKEMKIVREDARRLSDGKEMIFRPRFSDKVALLKFYPGMKTWIIDELIERGYKGIVIEGTGLGHVNNDLVDSLHTAIRNDIVVVMTTQCIFGTVNLNVYSKGRKLLEAGVVPAEDMLPETAYTKLSWLIANYDDIEDVKRLLKEDLVGEIEGRRTLDLYPRWKHE
jgi:glutamyl-tRNA(Gln) amidotransferase subunit D